MAQRKLRKRMNWHKKRRGQIEMIGNDTRILIESLIKNKENYFVLFAISSSAHVKINGGTNKGVQYCTVLMEKHFLL